MSSSFRPEQAPPDLRVGDYTLLSRLGEGGMGVVHLARRPGGARVALKVLRPHVVGDDEARQRLAREVSSLSRIRSRWVAEIVDADPWAEIPYVATRYVPGLCLHDLVAEEGPIRGDDLRWFAECLAEGLGSVHAVGVLHRDVKPSNVIMEGRTPILIDFGLARVADDPRLTHTGWLLGTPGYLAPEILHGDDAGEASDVHSWAATVAFAGTGRPPFGRGPSMAIMDRVRRGEHDLSGLPADVREVVDRALDPDPRRRPTLAEVRDRLVGGPLPVASTESDAASGLDDRDPCTVPLALAAEGNQPTVGVPVDDTWDDTWDDDIDGDDVYDVEAHGGYAEDDLDDETRWLDGAERAPVVPLAERARRGLLAAGLGLAGAVAVTAYPWLALAVIALLTWLLRGASLAGSAAGARRSLRGARWYDGPQLLLASPWHAVQAIPGAALLVLWSLGLALAGALVCYAVDASEQVTLFASGAVLVVSLWVGPGGSRFRGPVSRLTAPLCRRVPPWTVAWVLVVGGSLAVALLAQERGVDWGPVGDPVAWFD